MIFTKQRHASGRTLPNAYGLTLVSPPTVEPVTLSEAKAHLRLDDANTTDDDLITALISTARQCAETFLSRALISQTWQLHLDNAPSSSIFELPNAPLISVDHVKVYDEDDAETIISPDLYFVDTARQPGRLVLRSGVSWLQGAGYANRCANGFEVKFTAGYGTSADDVPPAIRQGILIHLASLYAERGDRIAPDGQVLNNRNQLDIIPATAYALYAPYRLLRIG